MVFESVRGYVELASGLGDLTRARAMEAAQGLLSVPAASLATGSKVAAQVSSLADELLVTAAANRSNLRELVRSEVDVAIAAVGLVPAVKLKESQAEAARLRAEVARLRSSSTKAAAPKAAAAKRPARKASARTAKSVTTATRSTAQTTPAPSAAVTTRAKSADA
jgi:hypothetical protein